MTNFVEDDKFVQDDNFVEDGNAVESSGTPKKTAQKTKSPALRWAFVIGLLTVAPRSSQKKG
jgi:hypothetical protein